MAEIGPDQLIYVDRRNNVLKLAQGEFVTVAKLEAVFGNGPLVRQIYVYGNSERPYLLAVVVPTDEALAASRDADRAQAGIARIAAETAPKRAELQSYEIPRDFLVETEPFTPGERAADRDPQAGCGPSSRSTTANAWSSCTPTWPTTRPAELRALRAGGADGPVIDDGHPRRRRTAGCWRPPTCRRTRTSPIWAGTRCPR